MKNKIISISMLILVPVIALIAGTAYFTGNKTPPPVNRVKPLQAGLNLTQDEKRTFSLPKGYPIDLVPVFPGAHISASGKREDPQKNIYYSLVLSSDKSPAEITDYYGKAFSNLPEVKKGGSANYSFFRRTQGKLQFSVSIITGKINNQPKTLITILVTSNLEKDSKVNP